MKEIKVLIIVIAFSLVTYWGVEPFAHSQMHPHTTPADFTFSDLKQLNLSGSINSGEALVQTHCVTCHSIDSQGLNSLMSAVDAQAAYGVVPPDLSNAGSIYSRKYLANFLKNPIKATQLSHKFSDDKPYGMPGFSWMEEEKIGNMIAYLKSIAKNNISNKVVFKEACGRCHSMRYDNFQAVTSNEAMQGYLGAKAPDLSMVIRSKKREYLNKFINEPLKMRKGVAMPRVGLTQKSQKQVIAYLEAVGDSKKEERESLGIKLMGFMALFTLIAYLWKLKIWREV